MLTPYQFASNSPIQCIDLDGLEGTVVSTLYFAKGTDPVTNTVSWSQLNPGEAYGPLGPGTLQQSAAVSNGQIVSIAAMYNDLPEEKSLGSWMWDEFINMPIFNGIHIWADGTDGKSPSTKVGAHSRPVMFDFSTFMEAISPLVKDLNYKNPLPINKDRNGQQEFRKDVQHKAKDGPIPETEPNQVMYRIERVSLDGKQRSWSDGGPIDNTQQAVDSVKRVEGVGSNDKLTTRRIK
jgi:hypothetical protein